MRHPETTNEVIGVLVVVLTGLCALGFPFLLSGLLGRLRMVALAALIAVIVGAGVGYAGAWFDAYEESRGDYHFNHLYHTFSLLALPASLLAEAQLVTAIGREPRVGIFGITSPFLMHCFGSSSPYFLRIHSRLSAVGAHNAAVMHRHIQSTQTSPNLGSHTFFGSWTTMNGSVNH